MMYRPLHEWRQEGYQSCEAGHGEGHACAHIGGAGGEGGVDVNAEVPVHWDTHQLGERAGGKRDYSGLRMKNHTVGDKLYRDAMFVAYVNPAGNSFYDCENDPWQTNDLFSSLPAAEKTALSGALSAVKDCKGMACP